MMRLGPILRRWASEEEGRFVLWAPLFLLVGIVVYFQLPQEPPLSGSAAATAVCGLIWARGHRARHRGIERLGRGLFFIVLGILLASVRTATVTAPQLPNETVSVRIEGELMEIEHRPKGQRLLIAPIKIGGIAPENLPARIRLTWRGTPGSAVPGDIVALRGVVAPPPTPTMPGGYDYGRQLFFERIGGVGFAVAAPKPIFRPDKTPLAARTEALRTKIANRIMSKAPGEPGTVLAAITTGMRAQIPEPVTAQLRDTGLAHLLAISGVHMGLVCGFLFISLRMIFLLTPSLATRFPVKKWAAVGALCGGFVYLMLSGGAWSAQRAFIMAAIGFIAIINDRRAISLRNVALAALLILALRPEAAISAGFQMSFAAVTALVAAYEAWERARARRPVLEPPGRVRKFLSGVAFTSLVAGAATAPFAIYHFGRIANFGFAANLAVMPVFSGAVMPLAVMGLLAMPLGLDAPFWWAAGHAISFCLMVTEHIAQWPGAVASVAQWPASTFGILVAGMLFACVAAAPWRLAGAMAVPIALGLAVVTPQPVMIVDEGAGNFVIREPATGELSILSRRRGRFAAETWVESLGLNDPLTEIPRIGPCDDAPCRASVAGHDVLVTTDFATVAEQCAAFSVVVVRAWTDGALEKQCPSIVLTQDRMADTGSVSIFNGRDGLRVETTRRRHADRPWVR